MNKSIVPAGLALSALVLMGQGCLFATPPAQQVIPQGESILDDDAIYELFQDDFGISPNLITEDHTPQKTDCPQVLPEVALTGPEGSTFEIVQDRVPSWLNITSPPSGALPSIITPEFNCGISELVDQQGRVDVIFINSDGARSEAFFEIFMNIEKK